MLIETDWDNLKRIPWESVFRCAREYKANNPQLNDIYYKEYMINEYGIDYNANHIRITDEKKYLLFLLKWG